MKYEHKANIDAANREGKSPSEIAHELLGHDLLKAMVTSISKPAVAFSKMSEQQQEAVIEDLKKELLPAISTAIGVIASNNTHTVRMKLKKMAVGTNYQITGQVDKTQDFIHELMDKTHDQSDVLIVLHERDYVQGLDGVKAEKDQKDLPLEDAPTKAKRNTKPKSEPKPVELTEGLISQAVEFVTSQQNGTLAGIQNQFKIDNAKGRALLAKLGELGLVGEPDERGDCKVIIQPKQAAEQKAEDPAPAKHHAHDLEADEDGLTLFCDELVKRATAKVREDGKVSRGALCITFDLDDAVAQQVIDQLKADGVIDESEEVIPEKAVDDSQME